MSTKIEKVITRFESACVDRYNKHKKDPNNWNHAFYPTEQARNAVTAEYAEARAALVALLQTGLEITEELTAQYEAGAEPITDAAKAGVS